MPEEQILLGTYLADPAIKEFVFLNLRQSLSDIGFSAVCIEDLISGLDVLPKKSFDVVHFGITHGRELEHIYSEGFFQGHVPSYFLKYVVPVTPSCQKIIDVGCGTGILAKLYAESGKFGHIVGIDLNPYPEWTKFTNSKIRFDVVREDSFDLYMKRERPDMITLTWTLHHMSFDQQERYVKSVYDILMSGSKAVILEDAYSTMLPPENGVKIYEKFMMLNSDDRNKAMSIYDWVANRVLAQRQKVPIPFGYRTAEKWCELFESAGFKREALRFIGFPEKRDINTPQALMVFRKD